MLIINKPEQTQERLIECKCYKCGEILHIHPMCDAKSPWIIDCELHKKKEITDE